jgi:prolyl 4-hydroxylase
VVAVNTQFPGLQCINEEPYIFVVHDFLSKEECNDLLFDQSTAEARAPSATSREQADLRTSTTVFPQTERVTKLRERIANLTKLSEKHFEPTKLTHYDRGQFFGEHTVSAAAHLG